MAFLAALSGRVKLWLVGTGAFVIALFAAYLRGRSDAAAADHERELNEYVETRRRIDDATIPHSADAAHEWLRKRQQERGL